MFIPRLLAVFALLTALCFGIWLAALNVRYRDIIYTVPFQTIQAADVPGATANWLSEHVDSRRTYAALYGLNPLAGLIEGLPTGHPDSTTHPWSEVAVLFLGMTIVLSLWVSFISRAARAPLRTSFR